MRYAPWALVLLAGCSPKPVNPDAPPVYEWICTGRTSDRQVKIRVNAADREEALAKAKQQYPDLGAAACTPNPRR